MIKGKVTFDARQVTAMLTDIERRQLPYAHTLALTNTALFARKQVIDEMRRVFDRPRPQTVNEKTGPLKVKTADRRKYPDDFSEVRVKDFARAGSDPALVFLSPHIRGNTRIEKRSEYTMRQAGVLPAGWFAVPGPGAQLDQYGNLKRAQLNRVLDVVRRARGAPKDKTREVRTGGTSMFVVVPNTGSRLTPGVWQRGAGRAIAPVLLFIQGAPRYRKRLRWEELAEQAGRMRFPIEFRLAMKHAIATARVEKTK